MTVQGQHDEQAQTKKKTRRDGTGSFFHTKTGWVAQIRYYDEFTGKSKQIRRRAKNRDEARELLKTLREANLTATPANASTLSAADYVRVWVRDSLPHQGLAASTQEMYASVAKSAVIPALGEVKLTGLTPTLAEEWLRRLDTLKTRPRTPRKTKANPDPKPIPGHPLAASTKRIAFNVLIKALDTAHRDGLIDDNPLRQVKRPTPGRPTVPVVEPDQAEKALKAAEGKRFETLLWFVTWTGVRLGEALALRWSDVDLNRSTATIRSGAVGSDRTKTGTVRSVTLIPEVVDRLKAWKRAQNRDRLQCGEGWANTEGYVFVTGSGLPMDAHNVRRDLKALLVAEKLPSARPWHSLRHGLAKRLLERGMPLQQVSAMLGHSSIRVTADTYGHVNPVVDQDTLVKVLGR
jgi:integrase